MVGPGTESRGLPGAGAASAIYEGRIRHRRVGPRPHAFTYRLYQMYLDLDELPMLFDPYLLWSARRPALGRFKREDYYGEPEVPLAECIRRLVEERLGRRPAGPIRLLTHLRTFGHVFNPVSFYYCFGLDAGGGCGELEAIVPHITNTPWGEDYAYVLDAGVGVRRGKTLHFDLDKDFHVSPFMDMDIQYGWRFMVPGPDLLVHMESFQDGKRIFDATLTLQRHALNGATLRRVLARYPLMSVKVVAGIYYQALRLWMKRTPFFTHPGKRDDGPKRARGVES